ncbi:MAG TPA: NUDIX hydrolase [Dehalococcoidia bacterium]|nr:NUDIX hydrolase [Dehalococcoidia bacterium]
MPERLPTPRFCQVCGQYLVERYVEKEGQPRLQCEGCGFTHYMNPRVVVAVIVERGGRVLLQQRAIEPRRGYWTFPGGFLEFGESPADGAVRETKEEVGLDVSLTALHGVYARTDVGIVLVVYRGTSESDDAYVGDFESMAVRWYAIDELPWEELAFVTTEQALREFVAQERGQP